MSKAQKALEKILQGLSDNNVTFDEAIMVLTRVGFVYAGGKGSHQAYRHADGRKIILPRHGKDLKVVYVKQIRELLK